MKARAAGLAVVCAGLVGCAVEERVVKWDPPMAGLPGAQTGRPVVREQSAFASPEAAPDGIAIENEDGTVTLVSRSGRHLMVHIWTTIENDEESLFVEQVLSDRTAGEFVERGYDPAEAYRELVKRKRDVAKLFAQMPQGEMTPGVLMEKVGEKTYRLGVSGPGTEELRWRFMDMVMEGGNWRLRWFGR